MDPSDGVDFVARLLRGRVKQLVSLLLLATLLFAPSLATKAIQWYAEQKRQQIIKSIPGPQPPLPPSLPARNP